MSLCHSTPPPAPPHPAHFSFRLAPGQRNEYFNFRAIALWLLSALYQCAVTMVLILLGCRSTAVDRASGQPFTMWMTGLVMFSSIIVTVHFQASQGSSVRGRLLGCGVRPPGKTGRPA
jgi:hypothetical protein